MTSIIYRCFYVCTDLDEMPWFFVTSQIFDDTIIIFTKDCNNNNLLIYTYIHLMQPVYCFGYCSFFLIQLPVYTLPQIFIWISCELWLCVEAKPKIDYLMFKSFSYVRLVFRPFPYPNSLVNYLYKHKYSLCDNNSTYVLNVLDKYFIVNPPIPN